MYRKLTIYLSGLVILSLAVGLIAFASHAVANPQQRCANGTNYSCDNSTFANTYQWHANGTDYNGDNSTLAQANTHKWHANGTDYGSDNQGGL